MKQKVILKYMQQGNSISDSYALNVSVSKHLRDNNNSGWMIPPAWKLNVTHLLIRIDHTSAPQSTQAALKVAEPVPATKLI